MVVTVHARGDSSLACPAKQTACFIRHLSYVLDRTILVSHHSLYVTSHAPRTSCAAHTALFIQAGVPTSPSALAILPCPWGIDHTASSIRPCLQSCSYTTALLRCGLLLRSIRHVSYGMPCECRIWCLPDSIDHTASQGWCSGTVQTPTVHRDYHVVP